MIGMPDIDAGLAFILGALGGFVLLNTRLRKIAQLLPVVALAIPALGFFGLHLELPSFARPALFGAGLAVLILGRS